MLFSGRRRVAVWFTIDTVIRRKHEEIDSGYIRACATAFSGAVTIQCAGEEAVFAAWGDEAAYQRRADLVPNC